MKIKNVSGQDLVVPYLGRMILAGQVVDVPDDDAESYTCQTTVWEPVAPAGDDDNQPGDPPADHEEG